MSPIEKLDAGVGDTGARLDAGVGVGVAELDRTADEAVLPAAGAVVDGRCVGDELAVIATIPAIAIAAIARPPTITGIVRAVERFGAGWPA
ncbi:MAG: hypothetical protein ACM3JP_01165 [Betaproteobacteria bacterium]